MKRGQQGFSIIELMIATVVLVVGVLGTSALMVVAIGANGRSRLQSNSTAVAQMVAEKISSVGATVSPNLTIVDCNSNSNTVATAGSSTGVGATLLSTGDVDFTQTLGSSGAPANYYMLYYACGTAGRQAIYDVRWNISTPSGNVKLITVSAKSRGTSQDPKVVAFPSTIRFIAGPKS